MIRRLSETWRQEKNISKRQDGRRKKMKHMTSILDKSSNKNNGDNTNVNEDIIYSPPKGRHKNKKQSKRDTLLGLSSVDWALSDSLLNAVDQNAKTNDPIRKPQLVKKSVENYKQDNKNVISTIPMQKSPECLVQSILPEEKTEERQDESHKTIVENSFEESNSSAGLSESFKDNMELISWNLPQKILQKYYDIGIKKMFPWQLECLSSGNALQGGNLVYSAPTSAGKTLVAEILMLNQVMNQKKKAMFILPFVSVAREKMFTLRSLLEDVGVRVGGFMGSETPAGGFKSIDIAVCTIEKANSIVNHLMEEKKTNCLCCVVVDELHLIGDSNRGYLLEVLLTKLIYLSNSKRKCLESSDKKSYMSSSGTQIIGMSATLPNLKMIADWLNASLYVTDYRPVPLQELFKIGNELMDRNGHVINSFNQWASVKGDDERIIPLVMETLNEQKSVLIFCPTKVWCEKLAELLALFLSNNRVHVNDGVKKVRESDDKIEEVLEQLRRSAFGLDRAVERVVRQGVAFHHAGLTVDERDIIEGSFRRGIIKIIIATSTLSSGVNLPARRVIIRSPIYRGKPMDPLVYKQMAGRAGRKGVDTLGQSVLMCKPNEKEKIMSLLNAPLKPVHSSLMGANIDERKNVKRAILEIIAGGVAVTSDDVKRYFTSSYFHNCLAHDKKEEEVKTVNETISFLIENEFVALQANKENVDEAMYFPSQLGVATLASSLSPDEALLVFQELQKARKSFVLECELHMIYQVTPIFLQDQWPDLDWTAYFHIWERLSEIEKLVAERVGVTENFLARAICNRLSSKGKQQQERIRIHKRFYTALVLQDLVNEVPLNSMTRKFKINRGLLQSLQNSSATFAGMVTVFCQKLGWSGMELLLEQFQTRLTFGVARELCGLVRINLLNAFLARKLYESGYHTASTLAYANNLEIAKILRDSVPFESKNNIAWKNSQSARFIRLNGREGLTENEAAELIIKEAKRIMHEDAQTLGVALPQNFMFDKKRPLNTGNRDNDISLKKKRRSNEESNHDEVIAEINENFNKKVSPSKKLESEKLRRKRRSSRENTIAKTDYNNIKAGINKENMNTINNHGTSFLKVKSINEEVNRKNKTKQNTEKKASKILRDSEVRTRNLPDIENNDNVPGNFIPESNIFHPNTEKNNSVFASPIDLFTPIQKHSKSRCKDDNMTNEVQVSESPDLINNPTSSKSIGGSQSEIENKSLNFDCSIELMDVCSANNSLNLIASDSSFIFQSPKPLQKCDASTVHKNRKSRDSIELIFSSSFNLTQNSLQKKRTTRLSSSVCASICDDDFSIIDVTASMEIYQTFLQELDQQKTLGISFAYIPVKRDVNSIGGNIKRNTSNTATIKSLYQYENYAIIGVAFCWGERDAYYVQINDELASQSTDVCSSRIGLEYRINSLKKIFSKRGGKELRGFDMKFLLKNWYNVFQNMLECHQMSDPKVAQWLLEPDERPKMLHELVHMYLKDEWTVLADAVGEDLGCYPVFGKTSLTCTPRVQASIESVLVLELMSKIEARLAQENLLQPFVELEMKVTRCLAAMEINGLGFSRQQFDVVKSNLHSLLKNIEVQCFKLAGRKFSLSSPNEVAQVLFVELGLPANGDGETARHTRSKQTKNIKSLSTSKKILEKLAFHPLPGLIMEWRKLHSTFFKVALPLEKQMKYLKCLDMYRIFSESQFSTSTGRITFSEPNLQNVPKPFTISNVDESIPSLINVRSVFISDESSVLISADYSQLELRIIAHLSDDAKLKTILNADNDVFKSIAAETRCIPIDEVTNEQRQVAKQICYGLLYGIGPTSLAEQLKCEEERAICYMDEFMKKYAGVKKFIQTCVSSARMNGYVTTILNRKRYLPDINSPLPATKSHAERQAVNTTVQGSAADLVKSAMININRKLYEKYGPTCRVDQTNVKRPGSFLVLQIHDELLYEVKESEKEYVSALIRCEMENALSLSVRFPVKLKIGKNWGAMDDIQ